MRKRLAVLGFFGWVACGAWPQVPRNGSQQKQRAESSDTKAQSAPKPCTCNVQIQETPAKEKQDSPSKPSSYPWRELYAPANIPNWVLALVGIGAVIAALKTLWAIRKQADLQAAGMKQWIDVQVIKSTCEQAYVLGGVEFHAERVEIWFSATNQTDYPLTIQKIFVKISGNRSDGPTWEPYTRKGEIILSPGRGKEPEIGKRNAWEHRFFITIDLDAPMAEEYKTRQF